MSYGTINGLNITSTNRIALPIQRNRLVYTGNSQSPEWEGYNSNILKIKSGSTNSATDAGKYPVTFQLNTGYVWMDGTTGDKISYWTIERLPISKPYMNTASTYNDGNEITANLINATNGVTITQNKSKIAGKFNAIAVPDSNHCWTDGSYDPIIVPWEVKPKAINVPIPTLDILYYTGQNIQPVFQGEYYNCILEGEVTAIDAGIHIINITPDENHCWLDGTRSTKNCEWMISEQPLEYPTVIGDYIYNGNSQSVNLDNFTSSNFEISGETSGIGAGIYTIHLIPDKNHCWMDNKKNKYSIKWEIERAVINVIPYIEKSVFNYTGREISINILGYDQQSTLLNGTKTAIEDYDYWISFTPDNNHKWATGKIEPIEYQWSIIKEENTQHITADVKWSEISEHTKDGTASQLYEIGSYKFIKLSHNFSDYVVNKYPTMFGFTRKTGVGFDAQCLHYKASNGSNIPIGNNEIDAYESAHCYAAGAIYDKNEVIVKAIIIGINHNSSIEGSKRIHWLGDFNLFGKHQRFFAGDPYSGPIIGKYTSYFYDCDLYKSNDKLINISFFSILNYYYTPMLEWYGYRKNLGYSFNDKPRFVLTYYSTIVLDYIYSLLNDEIKSIITTTKKYYIGPDDTQTSNVENECEFKVYSGTTYFWPLDVLEINHDVNISNYTTYFTESYRTAFTELKDKVEGYEYFKNGNSIKCHTRTIYFQGRNTAQFRCFFPNKVLNNMEYSNGSRSILGFCTG